MVRSALRTRSRLVALAVFAAAVAPGSGRPGPAAAASRPAAGTSESPAVPAPFPLPLDTGTRAVADLARARAELPAARAAASAAAALRADLDDRWVRLGRALDQAQAAERAATVAVDAARREVRELAVRAYVHGSSGGSVAAAVESFGTATDVVSLGRDLRLIEQVGSERTQELARRRAVFGAAKQRVTDLLASRDELARRRDDAGRRFAAALRAAQEATDRIDGDLALIEQFHRAATTSASPILGPSRLSAGDLAAFVLRSGYEPRATAPIRDLAAMYLQEGDAEGVRGDVAFAQSILETGWFTFPDGGQVRPDDNNFAGIGACDGCGHGFSFPTAREGVRAQIQLLRTYADGEVGADGFAHAVMLPGALDLGFRGDVRTWRELGGYWATGPGYGDHLYALYRQMVTGAGYP